MSESRRAGIAAITRRYPFYSGGASLVNHPFFLKLTGSGEDISWIRGPAGYTICTPANDFIGRALFFLGDYDPKITWVCRRLVRPGDTVLDIGANIGIVSLLLSSLVGPSGKVYSFEPQPELANLLTKSIERNEITNINLQAVALGAVDGELEISVPRCNYGAASFVRSREWDDSFRLSVPVKTLSNALATESLERIRLVKIDVEGFEPEVFRGAAEIFEETPPDVVVFELNDLEGSLRQHPSVVALRDYGYQFLSIPRRLVRMSTKAVDLSSDSRPRAHDFVAVQSNMYMEVAARLRARPSSQRG